MLRKRCGAGPVLRALSKGEGLNLGQLGVYPTAICYCSILPFGMIRTVIQRLLREPHLIFAEGHAAAFGPRRLREAGGRSERCEAANFTRPWPNWRAFSR